MAPYLNNSGPNNSGSHYFRSRSSAQPPSSPYPPQYPAPKPVSGHRRGSSAKRGPVPRRVPKPIPKPRVASQAVAPQTVALQPPLDQLQRNRRPGGTVLAGGSMMLALMAILLPHSIKSPDAKANVCQQQVQIQSVLSRDKLSKLLSIPERSSKEAVRQVIAEPYCMMSSVEVRQGVSAEREAYPLEFDPQTWVVVLYEGNEYAGYDFSFQHP